MDKPKLDIDGQIEHLFNKGVKFEKTSIEEAKQYLRQNNNFFKLTAYRKTFLKDNEDKYKNLDFSHLKDLAIIDKRLRYLLIQMSLDIEHYAKVQLIDKIEKSNDDGYNIVLKYFDSLGSEYLEKLEREIERNKKSPYCGDLIKTYNNGFPVWAFVEIITLGTFLSFYKYCADSLNDKKMLDIYYRMLSCKDIRNASAHNNCIINDLTPNNTKYKTNYELNKDLMKIKGISKDIRTRKMSNIRIQQIITLLYTHKTLVSSTGVKINISRELKGFGERLFLNMDYKNNDTILTTFNFLKLVIDNWY